MENAPTHYPEKILHLADENATADFAHILAQQPNIGHATIILEGDLGAGKTTLVRHLLRSLGVKGRIKSPTYAIVEPHRGENDLSIWHFDFYRFNDPSEWHEAGLADIFAERGLKLAEWPQKAPAVAAAADLCLHLQPAANDARLLRMQPRTALGLGLMRPWDVAATY